MEYIKFQINQYKGIKGPLELDISKNRLIPLVGINECGKTTILKAILSFDYINDTAYKGEHLERLENLYSSDIGEQPKVAAFIKSNKQELLNLIDGIKNNPEKVDINEEIYESINCINDFSEIIITRDLLTKEIYY